MLRTIRNVVLSIVVLALLFIGAGVGYVLFTGEDQEDSNSQPVVAKTDTTSSLPKPSKPNPSAPVGVSVQSLMSPVKPGENSSISIRTTPTASCAISVTYNNVPAKDSGLATKSADDYGNVAWSWTVDKSAPVGKWPVKITCTYNKKSGVAIGDLQVGK